MTLTDEHIAQLFRFCEKKFVRYYDLQLELVDHLAERIEEEIEKDKTLSFEKALDKVYKGFGIFGFAHIVRDKEIALQKANSKLWWKEFSTYFTIPKLVLTLCLFAVFYSIGMYLAPEIRSVVILLTWFLAGGIQVAQLARFRKREVKKLMMTVGISVTALPAPIFYFYYFVLPGADTQYNWLFSLMVTLGIVTELVFIDFNKRIYNHAAKLYPQAFANA
jgi:hypothetical protein